MLGIAAAASSTFVGCKTQSIDTRGRFLDNGVSLQAHAEWSGEKIEIDNAGVTLEGGLSVITDPSRNRVRAIARMLALADALDKPSADEAIVAATLTFTVTTAFNGAPPSLPALDAGSPPTLEAALVPATLTSVRCGHGRTVRSAAADDVGCDALDVLLPAGTDEHHLFVTARSGVGRVGVSLKDAVLGGLDLHARRGSIDVAAPATAGAVITIVAETGDDVVLRLPLDFEADLVTLDTGGAIDTAAFPGVQSGKGRGEPGHGAKSITVQSTRNSGTGGVIRLLAQ